ncbi:hypothetical protein DH2020_000584 [Rehmannia glutinosa]|uniref:GTP cyclohydrolase 1 n=1 Tax=Rehmannia glutinosa TaxID=99300 RepID=A0ABR0XWX3_REHGL
MGALDECQYIVELENGVNLGDCIEPEALAIEDAVRVLLQGLGEDINREGLRKTPHRVAKALREGTRGYNQNVMDIVSGALFPEAGVESKLGNAGGAGGLVIVRDLDLFSYCESCLLPFQVKCHVGYVPSGHQVVGLSKLSRVAEVFAKRLQDPQRLANEISAALQHSIKPTGVAVVLQCSHIHFPIFSQLSLTQIMTDGGLNVENAHSGGPVSKSWCPSEAFRKMGQSDSAMIMHIGYYSSNRVNPVGKSLLQSIVHFYGFKLQVQERLTRQIAESVSSFLGEDVMVVVEANHTCMISRGIEKFGSSTATKSRSSPLFPRLIQSKILSIGKSPNHARILESARGDKNGGIVAVDEAVVKEEAEGAMVVVENVGSCALVVVGGGRS